MIMIRHISEHNPPPSTIKTPLQLSGEVEFHRLSLSCAALPVRNLRPGKGSLHHPARSASSG